jgi:hydroxyethylthiazole kinase-like uncharacterized protein yjeF
MEHRLYSVAQLRAVEHAALPAAPLMQRAGAAAAAWALELIQEVLPVLVLAGPGNNGGDALEVAANLRDAGVDVTVLHLAGGASSASPETAAALARCQLDGVTFVDALPDHANWALVVDGLFGIGLARALDGHAEQLAAIVSRYACPILALDIPSGLDADTGALHGEIAVRATHTITFIGDKPGLHTGDGRDYAGIVRVASLELEATLPAPEALLLTSASFASSLPLSKRRENSHKGQFGDVAILGGAEGMAGAAMLAARTALFSGAGRVFLAALDARLSIDPLHPEIMFRSAVGFDVHHRTLVVGPGMGDSAAARNMLAKAISSDSPLVLDADALNMIAAEPGLQEALRTRAKMAILTPHPLEAARLLGVTAQVVQGDRLAAARELAARCHAVVVLKGSGTVIARPEGHVVINTSGNAGLATGGAGDVLAGFTGTLLAHGWDAWAAAQGAVWMHGAAADRLVAQGFGPIGLTAGELPAAIRGVFNGLV